MSTPTDLAPEWREEAEHQRNLGAEAQATTLEWCAERLEEQLREWRSETLTLQQAAAKSGYSKEHLARLIREGTLPDAGESNAPRVRRDDLPRKPGHEVGPAARGGSDEDTPVGSRTQMARSVVESE